MHAHKDIYNGQKHQFEKSYTLSDLTPEYYDNFNDLLSAQENENDNKTFFIMDDENSVPPPPEEDTIEYGEAVVDATEQQEEYDDIVDTTEDISNDTKQFEDFDEERVYLEPRDDDVKSVDIPRDILQYDVEEGMSLITQGIDNVYSYVENVNDKLNHLNSNVDNISSKLDLLSEVESRCIAIEQNTLENMNKLDKVHDVFGIVDTKLDAISQQLLDKIQDITQSCMNQQGETKSVVHYERKISALEMENVELRRENDEIFERLKECEKQFNTIKEKYKTLQQIKRKYKTMLLNTANINHIDHVQDDVTKHHKPIVSPIPNEHVRHPFYN